MHGRDDPDSKLVFTLTAIVDGMESVNCNNPLAYGEWKVQITY